MYFEECFPCILFQIKAKILFTQWVPEKMWVGEVVLSHCLQKLSSQGIFAFQCLVCTTTPNPPLQVLVWGALLLSSGLPTDIKCPALSTPSRMHARTRTHACAYAGGESWSWVFWLWCTNTCSAFLLNFRKSSLPLVLFMSMQVNDTRVGSGGHYRKFRNSDGSTFCYSS